MEEHLLNYARSFLGYGKLCAPVWIIGLEEAGDSSEEAMLQRLKHWKNRGSRQLEDGPEFKRLVAPSRYNRLEEPLIQQTLGKLIRFVFSAVHEATAVDREQIRQYQVSKWGSFEGDIASLELSALPAKNTKPSEWRYGDYLSHPDLQSRRNYRRFIERERVPRIVEALRDHKPTFVLCYGKVALTHWDRIRTECSQLTTKFEVIAHPTRLKNADLEYLGITYRSMLME